MPMKALLPCLCLFLLALPASAKEDAASANNRFAVDFYGRLESGDAFVSPLSLSTALAMTYLGARGETADQMARTLHFSGDVAQKFGQLQRGLSRQMSIANRLWPDPAHRFLPDYLKLLKSSFGADAEPLSYADPEKARQTINGWVEKATKGKIKDLLPRGSLQPNTSMVLTNAVYFKGKWKVEFDKKRTSPGPFYGPKTREVNFMNLTDRFAYLEGDDFQLLELPYADSTLAMDVLLPRERDGLARLEKSISADALTGWARKAHPAQVRVSLPRFTVRSRLELSKVLGAMGMPLAFGTGADFSGMDGTRELSIGKVFHQAVVEVNEEGTEAAAATAVVMVRSTSAQPGPEVFRADRPFLFLIRDTRSGAILFMGRLVQPEKV
ncbi:MAG: serpin family protein [Candidatus Eremiobacterota bacterium]